VHFTEFLGVLVVVDKEAFLASVMSVIIADVNAQNIITTLTELQKKKSNAESMLQPTKIGGEVTLSMVAALKGLF
jgi:hypothetical protein